jgi:adenylate cyclase
MPDSSRQLAAIMFSDIVGYTALMQKNETDGKLKAKHYRRVLSEQATLHHGNIIQNYGDGSLTIFASAVDATECAIDIQAILKRDPAVPLRIGIHLGDIVIDGEDIFGDGINVASRIESMGVAGGILVSQNIYNQIKNHKTFQLQTLGSFSFKNVQDPLEVFAITNKGLTTPDPETLQDKFKSPHKSEKSIAVLPFLNMSSDPEQEFFSDGISEEIINTIVQLPDLKVAGRTSSFTFKGQKEDLRIIGEKLGVKHVLEGSVRKFGNKVRITAQLIEASNGFHLWSKKYDRELDDVFKVQDEIALEIANLLQISLGEQQALPKPREQTQSVEAYQLYYKGRSLFYQRGLSLFEALDCFKAALAIDPDYALASSGLADTYVMLSFHGYLSPKECWKEAIPAAQKALDFGPELGETHNTLAIIALLHDWNLDKAEQEFKKALAINPAHIQARVWYGLFYLSLTENKLVEGNAQLKIAIETDPLSAYAHSCYSLNLTTMGKMKKAIEASEYAVKLDPNSMIAQYALGHACIWSGQLEKALNAHLTGLEISRRHAWILNQILLTHLKMGNEVEALNIFEEMDMKYKNHDIPPSNLAIAAADFGREKYAFELVNTALKIKDPYLNFVVSRLKDAEVLQQLPGFEKIREEMGYNPL